MAARRAQPGAGDGAVHRHRRLHPAGRPPRGRRWRELLEVHDDLARRLVEQFGGQLIKTTGDGILATFDSAAAPDEIFTSGTVRDLVVGSDIAMSDRGPHPLKGVDGTWPPFAASP